MFEQLEVLLPLALEAHYSEDAGAVCVAVVGGDGEEITVEQLLRERGLSDGEFHGVFMAFR